MHRCPKSLIILAIAFSVCFLPACKKKEPAVRPSLPAPDRSSTADHGGDHAPAPSVSLSASPGTIERGEQSTLKWNSNGGTSLTIDNGVGNVGTTGEIVISPVDSTTYTATVRGPGGEAKASTRVTVLDRDSDAGSFADTEARQLETLIREGKIKPVYFAYDKAELTAASKSTLQQNALLFRQFPSVQVIVEGHCDERGSEEYNLALGDRRALAVRDYLTQLGVEADRLEAVSYGEERPADNRKNEEAYARNRRAEFSLGR